MNQQRKSERGATMVEFSIVGTIVFLFLATITDISITLFQTALATYQVNIDARADAMALTGLPSTSETNFSGSTVDVTSFLKEAKSRNRAGILAPDALPFIETELSFTPLCMTCKYILNKQTITVRAKSIIESPSFKLAKPVSITGPTSEEWSSWQDHDAKTDYFSRHPKRPKW